VTTATKKTSLQPALSQPKTTATTTGDNDAGDPSEDAPQDGHENSQLSVRVKAFALQGPAKHGESAARNAVPMIERRGITLDRVTVSMWRA
jgi:hypothetical protein